MIFAFLNLFLFFLSLAYIYLYLGKKEPALTLGKIAILRTSPQNLKSVPHLVHFISFLSFLLLPLSIGLSIYLRTDANVVVVILWILWTYNWIKYTFWRE